MRIARFSADGSPAFGVVEGPPGSEVVARIDGHPFAPFGFSGERFPVADVRLLAPVLPSKVLAVGKNYADHISEMASDLALDAGAEMGGDAPEEPLVFLKPSTSVIGPGDAIAYPVRASERVDYEGELAVVIGRLCRDVSRERVRDVLLGYTCANDVTARDLQARDGQWTRAKGFDTFCPLGPWIETALDPAHLRLTTTVNDQVRQDASTSLLLHDVAALVAHVSAVMTLLPGDVLLTGTPAGVGPLRVGDVVSVTIDGIGTLTNRVVARA